MKAPLILLAAAALFSASCERHEWEEADGEGTHKLYPSHGEHGEKTEKHGEHSAGDHPAKDHDGH